MDFEPYNPLDERNLGASVAEALLERDPVSIAALPVFEGSGIYAIYYTGGFPTYTAFAERNRENRFEWPIYVGKAEGGRTRKGISDLSAKVGTALYSRLREHRDTINLVTNLSVSDFYCRALVVKDIWVPLGEALLLAKFSPIWNRILDGFGNHDPGSGRYNGQCPRWDILHPGRAWAVKCKPSIYTPQQLDNELRAYLHGAVIPAKPRFLAPS